MLPHPIHLSPKLPLRFVVESAIFNDVNAATSGSYRMTIYSDSDGVRTFMISANGGATTQSSENDGSWSIPSAVSTDVQLNAGSNSIEFSNSSNWAPNLDHIVLTPLGTVNPSFNIVYPTSDVVITAPGQSGTGSIALVPIGGFTENVAITCTLPASMLGASCTSHGANLTGTGSTTATLTITTNATTAGTDASQASLDHRPASVSSASQAAPAQTAVQSTGNNWRSSAVYYALFVPIPGMALVGFGLGSKKKWREKFLTLLILGIISAGLIGLAACSKSGGGNNGGSGDSTCSVIPSYPTGLTAGSTTITTTTLNWSAVTLNSPCVVTAYTVLQNNTSIGTTTSTSYPVTGLPPLTAYTFTVVASDSYGKSVPSASVGVTTAGPVTLAGTYPVTVTATSAGATQTTTFNVIVQ
jgi:cellulose 1,4-beta-cellobiosidase